MTQRTRSSGDWPAQKAAEEAERERLRALRRAENPDGIMENTSKKKLQKQQQFQKDSSKLP